MATQTQPSVDLSEDRSAYIIASVTTVLVLAIISTGLRLVARRIQKIKYGASDYVVVVALLWGICIGATILTGRFRSEPFLLFGRGLPLSRNSLWIRTTCANCEHTRPRDIPQGE